MGCVRRVHAATKAPRGSVYVREVSRGRQGVARDDSSIKGSYRQLQGHPATGYRHSRQRREGEKAKYLITSKGPTCVLSPLSSPDSDAWGNELYLPEIKSLSRCYVDRYMEPAPRAAAGRDGDPLRRARRALLRPVLGPTLAGAVDDGRRAPLSCG